jgi:hypothetical protein
VSIPNLFLPLIENANSAVARGRQRRIQKFDQGGEKRRFAKLAAITAWTCIPLDAEGFHIPIAWPSSNLPVALTFCGSRQLKI